MQYTIGEIANIIGATIVCGGENDDATARKINWLLTDSRSLCFPEQTLFFALKTQRNDGHRYIGELYKRGVRNFVVTSTEGTDSLSGACFLKVGNTLNALQTIAGHHRSRFDIPVVAITGSNGKTTTKDLTAAALSSLGSILKTSSNYNNEIGVPQTLFELNENHRAAVVEIGMRGLNQIRPLAAIVRPTIGIVTNVGEVHIELLGSIENIARAKAELVESIGAGGTVILNADDPHVSAMVDRVNDGVKVITYGLECDADIRA